MVRQRAAAAAVEEEQVRQLQELLALVASAALAASLLLNTADAQTWLPTEGARIIVNPDGTTTPTNLDTFATRIITVRDYGAQCNGSSDDSAAISAAFQAVASSAPFQSNALAVVRGIPGQHCVILNTVNATGLQHGLVRIEDLDIDCQVTAVPCIDAYGSRFLFWDHVHVEGSGTPTIGIQIGRVNSGSMQFCDNQMWSHVSIHGTFSVAALYNFACEVSNFEHLKATNNSSSASSFVLVLDGANHWGVTSAFVTESLAADTNYSFTMDSFINLNAQHFGAGTPIWIENAHGFAFIGSYAQAVSAAQCIQLFTPSTGGIFTQDMQFHLHCENNRSYTFSLIGSNTAPALAGLEYIDHYPEATVALFDDSTPTTVTANDFGVKVVNSLTSNIALWKTPSKWSVSTRGIYLPTSGSYSAPNAISGLVCLGATCTMH